MDQPAGQGRSRFSAFSIYLRTGLKVAARNPAEQIEVKFNPWHDADDGRFTFKGGGRYFAGNGGRFGGGGASNAGRSPIIRSAAQAPKKPSVFKGGGGATGSWGAQMAKSPKAKPRATLTVKPAPKPGSRSSEAEAPAEQPEVRHVSKNGYATKAVTTSRASSMARPRRSTISRRMQISTRADTPNWKISGKMMTRRGKRVFVDIKPQFEDNSQRPSYIIVVYWIGSRMTRKVFPNSPGVK